jgi:H+/Cl- antiporter ClcA
VPDQIEVVVPSKGFLLTAVWWRLVALSLGLALMGAVGALIFVRLVGFGTGLIWPNGLVSVDLFSGTLTILAIMTVAGLVVGIVHRLIPSADAPNVFGGLVEGRINTKGVPGGLLVSLVSLVGGFSVGPEVPTGMLAGGAASVIADRQEWDETVQKVTFRSAVSGAYGGLFTSPFVATMLILEQAPPRHVMYLPFLGIEVVASLVGFAVFFAVGGFADVLAELSLPSYDLQLWHFGVAIGMAGVGVAGGFVVAAFGSLFKRLAAPFAERVLLRGLLAGVALGLLAMAVPFTLFSGATTLPLATSQAATIGVAVLLISAVAKIGAMVAAQSFGFIGGPIFPLVFAGGVLGAAVHGVFPDIPLALSVTAGMAALPAAVLPLPLTLGILTIVIAGTSLELGAPVLTSSVIAALVVQGLKRTAGRESTP